MKSNKHKKRIIYLSITILIVIFIFGQSCLPGEVSGNESGKIVNLLNSISDFIGLGNIFTGHFVRKCAHFTEFALLGVFTRLTVSTFTFSKIQNFIYSSVCCLLVAAIDECIQFISPERGPAIQDVMLDFIGGLFGITIVTLIILLRSKKSK